MTVFELMWFVGGLVVGVVLFMVIDAVVTRRALRKYDAELRARRQAFVTWMADEEKGLKLRLIDQLARHKAIIEEISRQARGGRAPDEN